MKKWFVAVFASVLSLFIYTAISASPKTNANTFTLPANLRYIACEAFSGTAVETVIADGKLTGIASSAFADTASLSDIYLSSSVEYIADNAFNGSGLKTIHAIDNDYAKDWALKHDIQFVLDDIWTGINFDYSYASLALLIYLCCIRINPVKQPIRPVSRTAEKSMSLRPQDRAELHALDYRFP